VICDIYVCLLRNRSSVGVTSSLFYVINYLILSSEVTSFFLYYFFYIFIIIFNTILILYQLNYTILH